MQAAAAGAATDMNASENQSDHAGNRTRNDSWMLMPTGCLTQGSVSLMERHASVQNWRGVGPLHEGYTVVEMNR